MTLQTFQLDPAAGGVSQATFDAHTHGYRKVTRIGADSDDKFASPTWVDICLLYTSPSPRDATLSRMPSSA